MTKLISIKFLRICMVALLSLSLVGLSEAGSSPGPAQAAGKLSPAYAKCKIIYDPEITRAFNLADDALGRKAMYGLARCFGKQVSAACEEDFKYAVDSWNGWPWNAGGRQVGIRTYKACAKEALTEPEKCKSKPLVNKSRPRISGQLKVSYLLKPVHGQWSGGASRYQYFWYRNGKEMPANNLNGDVYEISTKDAGASMKLREIAYDECGNSKSTYSNSVRISKTLPQRWKKKPAAPVLYQALVDTSKETAGCYYVKYPAWWENDTIPNFVNYEYDWLLDGYSLGHYDEICPVVFDELIPTYGNAVLEFKFDVRFAGKEPLHYSLKKKFYRSLAVLATGTSSCSAYSNVNFKLIGVQSGIQFGSATPKSKGSSAGCSWRFTFVSIPSGAEDMAKIVVSYRMPTHNQDIQFQQNVALGARHPGIEVGESWGGGRVEESSCSFGQLCLSIRTDVDIDN